MAWLGLAVGSRTDLRSDPQEGLYLRDRSLSDIIIFDYIDASKLTEPPEVWQIPADTVCT
jgi:hypothetical protein